MKGVIFTEFVGMVEERWSIELAARLIDESDLPSRGEYTSVGTYDPAEMVTLVSALSAHVDVPVPDLLYAYGHYLFGRFTVLYPELVADRVDALDLLADIEGVIHAEVLKLYPDAELPRIDTRWEGPDRLVMVYRSPRRLGDVAAGLAQGAVDHLSPGAVDIERTDHEGDDPRVVFTLTRR